MKTPQIVEGVGVATVSRHGGKILAERIATAMSLAVLAANAAGISTEEQHSPVIRACMMASREAVKAAHATGDLTPIEELVAAAVAPLLPPRPA